jgi:adenylate cyclase
MAFWGAPLDQPNHAENACRAAVAMMKALDENKERFRKQYGVDVEVGVGLNSGTVSVGNMGSNENFAYTVIGDHVNLASRLEGLTKYYGAGIVTSRFSFETIEKAMGTLPPHRILDLVKVKGKKNAVELIEVFSKPMSQARAYYSRQHWDLATEHFQKVCAMLGGKDGPSEMYLERIAGLRANPPGKDWDGTWEMHSK